VQTHLNSLAAASKSCAGVSIGAFLCLIHIDGGSTALGRQQPDYRVENALVGVCQRCEADRFEQLIEQWPDSRLPADLKQRSLSAAAKACCEPIVSALLDQGADPSVKDEFWWSAFEKALVGDCRTLFWDLVLGMDIPVDGRDDLTMQRRKEAALLAAARWGTSHEVAALLAMGIEPDVQDSIHTPLHHAIAAGDAQSVTLLLRAGAQPKHVPFFHRLEDHDGPSLRGSAVMFAVDACRAEILELVLNACEPLHSQSLDELLIQAAFRPAPESVALLLERGANPLATTSGRSALELAAIAAKSPEMVRILINAGANPDAPNAQSLSPRAIVAGIIDSENRSPELRERMQQVLEALERPKD
jgi:hypothetical protein